jgi:hypothetical protein
LTGFERRAEQLKKDPIALPIILEDDASVLERPGDRAKAATFKQQAEQLRKENPDSSAKIKIRY